MKSLKDLLLNHKIPGVQLSEIRHICAQTASSLFSIEITPKQVDYHEGVVRFKVPPILKAEIALQHKKLIQKLTEQGVQVSQVK